jgi:type IV pilus assembly protein PilB
VPADLAGALAGRLKLDYLVIPDFPEDEIDPVALDLIGEERMRKYMALPLRCEDARLVVAMSDPKTSSRS